MRVDHGHHDRVYHVQPFHRDRHGLHDHHGHRDHHGHHGHHGHRDRHDDGLRITHFL